MAVGMECSLEQVKQTLEAYSDSVLRPFKSFPPHVARTALFVIKALLQEQHDMEQTAGRALGYPKYCDDQANFPGSTDADGVCVGEHVPATVVSELASSYVELKEYFKRGQG